MNREKLFALIEEFLLCKDLDRSDAEEWADELTEVLSDELLNNEENPND